MTMTTADCARACSIVCEPGNWLAYRAPHPEVASAPARLLAESAKSRPGNLRGAMIDGRAFLIGELRSPDGILAPDVAHKRLCKSAYDLDVQVQHDEVGCLLAETGFEWAQAEDSPDRWGTAITDLAGHRFEIVAAIAEHGIEVRSRIASWDGQSPVIAQEAFARFLVSAHADIRFARFILHKNVVEVISFAAADRLEVELTDSVAAVVAVHKATWREIRALTDAATARLYLQEAN